MMLLPLVFLVISLCGLNGLVYEEWFPDDFENCLKSRCKGVSTEKVPAFSIQFTCINYYLSRLNINKDLITGISEDGKNRLAALGRKLSHLLYEHKRKKRQTSQWGQRKRKEIRTFTAAERQAYFAAVNAIKSDGTYDLISNLHQRLAIPAGHFGPGFLGWHRVYLFVYQMAIWETNPNVVIPFCDTRLDNNMQGNPINTILFSSKYFGNANGITVTGPFRMWATPANVPLQRNAGAAGTLMTEAGYQRTLSRSYTREIILETSLANLESQHNNAHVWVGGLMGDLNYSPCDPFFFCHHSFIDYVWEQFRRKQYRNNIQAWNDYPANSDPYHQRTSKMEMVADYLRVNLTQFHGYNDFFAHPSIVDWDLDASHMKYPSCSNYEDIAANITGGTGYCHSKAADPAEARTANIFLESMRSSDIPRFNVSQAFRATEHDVRTTEGSRIREKRSTRRVYKDDMVQATYLSPMDVTEENDFLLDGVVDDAKWAFLPVRIVYKRSPGAHFKIGTAKFQREMEEIAEHKPVEAYGKYDDDLYSPQAYPKLWKKLKSGLGNPAEFGKSEILQSGAYKIMVQTIGFSYTGKYTDYAIIDERHPVSEVVAYVAFKRPVGLENVKSYITAYDPNGRVCQARCLVRGSNPPEYQHCSGVISINSKEPKMYGDNLGDAYLLRYSFQGDDLPNSHDGDIFLMFYCDYGNRFPWKDNYKKK